MVGDASLAELVQLERAKLKIEEQLRRRLNNRVIEPMLEERGLVIQRGEEFTINISLRGDMKERILPENIDSAFEAFLRIAFDHDCDVEGRFDQNQLPDIGWAGATFQFREFTYRPWPVPVWPTLLEWELLEPVWNERVHGAQVVLGKKEAKGEHPVVDALAHWLLQAQHFLAIRQRPTMPLSLAIPESEWARVAKRYWEAQKPAHRTHEDEYLHWLARILLMAAPEAGLSLGAAQALLETLPTHVSETQASGTVGRLRELRHRRMMEAGLSKDAANDFLTQMDDAHPRHPWHEFVGHWNPQSE